MSDPTVHNNVAFAGGPGIGPAQPHSNMKENPDREGDCSRYC
jgi:hypothetical protein